MSYPKVTNALSIVQHYSFKGYYNSKMEIQGLADVLAEVTKEIETSLNVKTDKRVEGRLHLCLLQMRYTVETMLDVLKDSAYLKKNDIFKLLTKKIYLCLKEVLNSCESKPVVSDRGYHSLMKRVSEAVSDSTCMVAADSDINSLIEELLCSCLTIAKLSVAQDFEEISCCCKHLLSALSTFNSCTTKTDFNISCFSYQVKALERQVNTAMLRLFLHIMSYPQECLKKLVRACGNTSKNERFSEDLDDVISEFDLACDRIGLIGNFALMSCEHDCLKLKVQNSLANLEFCEESLVPASVSFYCEPSHDKREFFKFLCNQWKSEVRLLKNSLDSIIDPAAFSLVAFDDLTDLMQSIKDEKTCGNIISVLYSRCLTFIETVCSSPDCINDEIVMTLEKRLRGELKAVEGKILDSSFTGTLHHFEEILSLVGDMSQHLNKTLNTSCTSSDAGDSSDWSIGCEDSGNEQQNRLVLNRYLEKAHLNSPFTCTMYQKTPLKKKIKDHVALSLDVSKYLGASYEA